MAVIHNHIYAKSKGL